MRALPVGIGWRHPHYAALLQTQPALDFIEVHSENFFGSGGAALALLEQARQVYPVSLHGVGLGLGSAAGIDEWHLTQLARLVERIDPVRVSDHASFSRAVGAQGGVIHAADLLPLVFNEAALSTLCDNVSRVQDKLQRRIAVENISAYLQWDQSDMPETDFLLSLARRTGCSLLIDVNNIYVNALNALGPFRRSEAQGAQRALAICMDWLMAMASASVSEIHLAGHLDAGEMVIDDHGSLVCPQVWALHRQALQLWGAVPSLIEWDTDVPALQVLLDEAVRARHNLSEGFEP